MKQKSVALCAGLVCFVLLTMLLPMAALAGGGEDSYIVSNPNPADRLNLRVLPTSNATSLGRFYNGVVVVSVEDAQNGWMKVRIAGTNVQGYMETRFLVSAGEQVTSAIPTATINNAAGTGLNIRQGQSSTSPLVAFAPNGTKVEVWGYGETYHLVKVSGGQGDIGFALASKVKMPGSSGGGTSGGSTGSGKVIAYATVYNPDPSDRLNLRASVDQKGRGGISLGKYYTGVQVEILEYVKRGGVQWAKVRIGNRTGYMQTQFLVIADKPQPADRYTPIVTVKNPKASDRLNLRQRPSDSAPSLGKYYNGTKVEVIGIISDTWSHVLVDGEMGFMMNRFLTPRPKFEK